MNILPRQKERNKNRVYLRFPWICGKFLQTSLSLVLRKNPLHIGNAVLVLHFTSPVILSPSLTWLQKWSGRESFNCITVQEIFGIENGSILYAEMKEEWIYLMCFLSQAGRGTVKPQNGFNANNDAETLFKAMKGLGGSKHTFNFAPLLLWKH